jgi:hypothetical protein
MRLAILTEFKQSLCPRVLEGYTSDVRDLLRNDRLSHVRNCDHRVLSQPGTPPRFCLDTVVFFSLEEGMNHKRGIIAFIVAFVFVFFFGYGWHGVLMKPDYLETSTLWRPEADFNSHFWILVVGHAVMAFAFTGLYVSKVGLQNPGIGFGYGIVIGMLCSGVNLIRFAVEPLTTKILWMWIVGDLLMFAIAGALVGAIYKPKANH